MLHIGAEVRKKLEERQQTVTWLAKEISCTRGNVYKIFEKSSLDAEILTRLSVALGFDFFSLYSEDIKKRMLVDGTPACIQ